MYNKHHVYRQGKAEAEKCIALWRLSATAEPTAKREGRPLTRVPTQARGSGKEVFANQIFLIKMNEQKQRRHEPAGEAKLCSPTHRCAEGAREGDETQHYCHTKAQE